MKLLEKILVATDFDKASEDALTMSFFLAREFHSEVILLHVIPEVTGYSMARGKLRKKVTERLRQMESRLKGEGIASFEAVVRFGIPFERIMEYSEELEVNLIVMGSGEKEVKYPLGITAERVMTYTERPVLVTKQRSRPPIHNILCPVDFSESSRRALKNAIHLSKTFGVHLTVLTVFEPLLSSFFGVGRTPGESKEKAMVKRQQGQFDRFLRGHRFDHLEWDKTIRRGKPHQEILSAIRDTKSDLLLMGSAGKTKLKRMMMGSTTEKVVREMPCSVIVLKQEHLLQIDLEKEILNMEAHFRKGKQLLGKDLTEGALAHFEDCIKRDIFFIPAWEGMAIAYQRMGKTKEAERCEQVAAYIRKHLWEKKKNE